MRLCRTFATLLATATALGLTAAAPASAGVTACSSTAATAQPTRANLDQVERTVLCLVNRERTRRGLERLRHDRKLAEAAARHSRDMVRREFFDHVSPGGGTMVDRIQQTGWFRDANGYACAENIAWGSSTLSNAKAIVESWMESPGHRRNILTARFTRLGVGVALGTPRAYDGATYTTNFGDKG